MEVRFLILTFPLEFKSTSLLDDELSVSSIPPTSASLNSRFMMDMVRVFNSVLFMNELDTLPNKDIDVEAYIFVAGSCTVNSIPSMVLR
jgi:hypothetical protein